MINLENCRNPVRSYQVDYLSEVLIPTQAEAIENDLRHLVVKGNSITPLV